MNRMQATLVAVLMSAGVLTTNAQAQLYDHMKCYKIQDEAKFRAKVTLDALQQQFGLNDSCVIKGKGKLFCVPVDKTSVTNFVDKANPAIPQVTYDGPEYLNDRICYKVKCPSVALAPELVTDQFGTRNIRKFKPMLLCTPAIKGVPTTTTTTVLLTNGSPCIGPQQCLSGWCVDGVCCDTSSCATCETCNLVGNEGVCMLAASGTDPHSDCVASSCIGSTFYPNGTCDGLGMCMLVNGQPCDPYVCDGNGSVCLASCIIDASCVAGNFCSGGACVAQFANGSPCGAANQCMSGNCFGGLCSP